MSNKLRSCVELENASIHQHTGKVSPSLHQTISARGYENVNSSNIVQSSLDPHGRNFMSSINRNSDTLEFKRAGQDNE